MTEHYDNCEASRRLFRRLASQEKANIASRRSLCAQRDALQVRLAAVKALAAKAESDWSDPKNVGISHTGYPSVMVHHLRAALAADDPT